MPILGAGISYWSVDQGVIGYVWLEVSGFYSTIPTGKAWYQILHARVSSTEAGTQSSLLRWCYVREDGLEEVPGEPLTLLVCCLKPFCRTIPRILHHLDLAGARVLAKQHDFGLGLRLVLVHPLQITQIVPVHRKDVVEGVEVFDVHLQQNGGNGLPVSPSPG